MSIYISHTLFPSLLYPLPPSLMFSLVSIFDITLIVDTICQSLSLHDIQACRQVNKQWSSLFKPHLWSHPKFPSTTTISNDTIATILDHKHWIRSFTIAGQHIEKISGLGFTHLQELVLYDQNFEYSIDNNPVPLDAIVSLIDSNPDLWNLEIDLNRCQYQKRSQPRELSPALMLAIARHPSLKRLVWHVLDGHDNQAFAKCLLYVCQQRQIQELYVFSKEHVHPYCNICDGDCSVAEYHSYPFRLDDEDHLKRLPEFRELKQKVEETPVEQMGSFAFKKLQLTFAFEECYIPLLKNCPDLQEISVDLSGEHGDQALEVLAGCPTLRGLDLRRGRFDMDYAREVQRFRQLQTVQLPQVSQEQLQAILDSLQKSSQETLEVLGLSLSSSPKDVVSVLGSFPNLKEIVFVSVRIYTRDEGGSNSGAYVPGAEDHTLGDCIVRDWDSSQMYRQDETMSEWWDHWTRAKQFMRAISSVYVQESYKSVLRPICMRYMYPIKEFMSEKEATDYARGTGAWAGSEKRTLTVADAKRMADAQQEEVDQRIEWRNRINAQTRNQVEEEEPEGLDFNEYDEVAADEPAREYAIAKLRNRHHSLRGKQPSPFRRPFKK
ncbi:hypothetical protein CPB97_008181 [Podila verticillata]|nr:hypothetical protein CPB97_008181 [Podila verticillata]